MPITINGNGTITGLSAGGLPAGSVTSATLAAGAKPITVAEQWKLLADEDINGSQALSNLGVQTSLGGGQLGGTQMTKDGSTFTFPSTGIYLVMSGIWFNSNGDISNVRVQIEYSSDSGSSFSVAADSFGVVQDEGNSGQHYNNASTMFIFDITDTTNQKVRMSVNSSSNLTYQGSSNETSSHITFIRLGAT